MLKAYENISQSQLTAVPDGYKVFLFLRRQNFVNFFFFNLIEKSKKKNTHTFYFLEKKSFNKILNIAFIKINHKIIYIYSKAFDFNTKITRFINNKKNSDIIFLKKYLESDIDSIQQSFLLRKLFFFTKNQIKNVQITPSYIDNGIIFFKTKSLTRFVRNSFKNLIEFFKKNSCYKSVKKNFQNHISVFLFNLRKKQKLCFFTLKAIKKKSFKKKKLLKIINMYNRFDICASYPAERVKTRSNLSSFTTFFFTTKSWYLKKSRQFFSLILNAKKNLNYKKNIYFFLYQFYNLVNKHVFINKPKRLLNDNNVIKNILSICNTRFAFLCIKTNLVSLKENMSSSTFACKFSQTKDIGETALTPSKKVVYKTKKVYKLKSASASDLVLYQFSLQFYKIYSSARWENNNFFLSKRILYICPNLFINFLNLQCFFGFCFSQKPYNDKNIYYDIFIFIKNFFYSLFINLKKLINKKFLKFLFFQNRKIVAKLDKQIIKSSSKNVYMFHGFYTKTQALQLCWLKKVFLKESQMNSINKIKTLVKKAQNKSIDQLIIIINKKIKTFIKKSQISFLCSFYLERKSILRKFIKRYLIQKIFSQKIIQLIYLSDFSTETQQLNCKDFLNIHSYRFANFAILYNSAANVSDAYVSLAPLAELEKQWFALLALALANASSAFASLCFFCRPASGASRPASGASRPAFAALLHSGASRTASGARETQASGAGPASTTLHKGGVWLAKTSSFLCFLIKTKTWQLSSIRRQRDFVLNFFLKKKLSKKNYKIFLIFEQIIQKSKNLYFNVANFLINLLSKFIKPFNISKIFFNKQKVMLYEFFYLNFSLRAKTQIKKDFIFNYTLFSLLALKKKKKLTNKEIKKQTFFYNNKNINLNKILWKWAKRRHNNRSNRWIYYRYWKKNVFFFQNNVSKYYVLNYNYQRKKYGL